MASRRITQTIGEKLAQTRKTKLQKKFAAAQGVVVHHAKEAFIVLTISSLIGLSLYGLGRLADKRCGYKDASKEDLGAVSAGFLGDKPSRTTALYTQAEKIKLER